MADRGMGRGLAAILSVSKPAEGGAEPAPELRELPVELIKPNPAQPRKHRVPVLLVKVHKAFGV